MAKTSAPKSPQKASRVQQVWIQMIEAIIPLDLLAKIARIRALGAQNEVLDICLQRANAQITSFSELVDALSQNHFRQIYTNLPPEIQQQIEAITSPILVAGSSNRRSRKESPIWAARHQIHKLKTEITQQQNGKGRSRQTWKRVTEALHKEGLLTDKTQQQIYWTLKDKRDSQSLTPEDKKLLDEMFARTERGKIKEQVEDLADMIEATRKTLSWEDTLQVLKDFGGWTGSLQQLQGAYARIRIKRQAAQEKAKAKEAKSSKATSETAHA